MKNCSQIDENLEKKNAEDLVKLQSKEVVIDYCDLETYDTSNEVKVYKVVTDGNREVAIQNDLDTYDYCDLEVYYNSNEVKTYRVVADGQQELFTIKSIKDQIPYEKLMAQRQAANSFHTCHYDYILYDAQELTEICNCDSVHQVIIKEGSGVSHNVDYEQANKFKSRIHELNKSDTHQDINNHTKISKYNSCNFTDDYSETPTAFEKADPENLFKTFGSSYFNKSSENSNDSKENTNASKENYESDTLYDFREFEENMEKDQAHQLYENANLEVEALNYYSRLVQKKELSTIEFNKVIQYCFINGKFNFQLKQLILLPGYERLRHQLYDLMQLQLLSFASNKNAFSLIIQLLSVEEYRQPLVDQILHVYPHLLVNENCLVVLINLLGLVPMCNLVYMLVDLLSNQDYFHFTKQFKNCSYLYKLILTQGELSWLLSAYPSCFNFVRYILDPQSNFVGTEYYSELVGVVLSRIHFDDSLQIFQEFYNRLDTLYTNYLGVVNIRVLLENYPMNQYVAEIRNSIQHNFLEYACSKYASYLVEFLLDSDQGFLNMTGQMLVKDLQSCNRSFVILATNKHGNFILKKLLQSKHYNNPHLVQLIHKYICNKSSALNNFYSKKFSSWFMEQFIVLCNRN